MPVGLSVYVPSGEASSSIIFMAGGVISYIASFRLFW